MTIDDEEGEAGEGWTTEDAVGVCATENRYAAGISGYNVRGNGRMVPPARMVRCISRIKGIKVCVPGSNCNNRMEAERRTGDTASDRGVDAGPPRETNTVV